MLANQYQTTFSSTKQRIESLTYRLQMIMPPLTTLVFLGFAFIMAVVIIVSLIPLYLENKSVPKTMFILTTVRLNNYILQTNAPLGKRALAQEISTFDEVQSMMNSSIQYALEEQLKAGDNSDKFSIYILKMTSYADNPSNMSVILDIFIIYTRECLWCNKHRQSIISQQLCSNNQFSTPIRFRLAATNFSYALSEPLTVYALFIPVKNIPIMTRIVSSLQLINLTNNVNINEDVKLSNKLLAHGYTLTVTTAKSNYLATLDQVDTHSSAKQNDGPVPLVGAVMMYSGLVQIIERQIQLTNGSNAFNVTINQVILQFWYSNSTIQVVVDFLVSFSTGCDNTCMNQRSDQLTNQLETLSNTQINIQPANLTDGQVRILKGGVYTLYDYSLTSQIIANFTGTIASAIPPTFTIIN